MLTETQKTEALKYKYIHDIIDKIRSGEVTSLVPGSSLTADTADAVQQFYADHNAARQEKLTNMSAEDLLDIIEEESREYGLSQAGDYYYDSRAEIDKHAAREELLRRLGEAS